jgi:hypothetical protein
MIGMMIHTTNVSSWSQSSVLLMMAVLLLATTPPNCQSFSIVPSRSSSSSTMTTTAIMATNTATGVEESLDIAKSSRQILEFIEPKTNVTVLLIGSMHYNPASISLVETTLEELGSCDRLGSVIIESCDIRWNKTQEILEKKPNDKDFLGNEMRAAWEVSSLKYNRPTILGDQRINITVAALKANFKDTVQDIFLRGPSGWKHSIDEIQDGWKQTTPINNDNLLKNEQQGLQGLNALSFLDPRLLISLPVSLVKYPLSFFLKDPIPFGLFFSSIIGLQYYADHGTIPFVGDFSVAAAAAAATAAATATTTASDLLSPPDRTISDYIISVSFAILETVVFARLLLKPLLAERNEILAKSILDQCKIYSTTTTAGVNGNDNINDNVNNGGNWFQQLFDFDDKTKRTSSNSNSNSDSSIIYVPGSSPFELTTMKTSKEEKDGGIVQGERKVVVAVLGMAHCNGIMKLLKEQKV